MPPVIVAAGVALGKIGLAVAGAVGATGFFAVGASGMAAVALGAAVVAGAALVATKAVNSLFGVDMPQVDSDASRQRTVKSTTEPFKTIYGESLVSGPITYIGMAGTDNADLYHVIALAGHEVTDIKDVYFDNKLITDAQINSGNAAGGDVIAGDFGPKSGSTICVINKHLGTATQAADSMMVSTFSDYTSAHQGKNVAYIAMKWTLNEDSAETWEKYAPSDIKCIVQGRKVYDPRLDVAAGNAAGANPTDASYIAYSTNPALCLADYLINSEFGLGVTADKVDWAAIVTAANGCDVSVTVPGGTESRYTCNGVLFGTDSHRTNINKILSSMNGTLVYSNGVYILRAGIYEAPTQSLNEDDLIGAIGIKTSFERSDRFNTIKGLFVDPAQNHKSSEFPKVQLADAVTRDNGEVLEKEMQFPMTNSSYGAQRIANKLIQLSDQQKVVTFPANLSALRITAGDRVQVSIEELSWSNKIFQCVGWTFADDGGVNLTLREDSSTSYADPASNEYSTITATGDITDAFRGVPSPSGLSATAGLKSNELNWVNPARPSDFRTIQVFASPNANFSSAVKIGETDGTQFVHDAANSVDAVSPGDVRYYWVRAIKNVGTDAASQSNLEPNSDPNTTVFSTVGRVNWSDIAGTTGAPADNATVGAQISVNLYDADGSTVMGQPDVKNSVLAQEIFEVEDESGNSVDLESGASVEIQTSGDVATTVASHIVELSTTTGDNTASITTQATSIGGLEAQYTVKIDNNNRIAGFGLASTSSGSTPTSEFVVIADKFSVVDPSSTTETPIVPFQITAQKILLTSDVEVSGSLLAGTIDANRINIDDVTLDTDANGRLIIKSAGVNTAQIASNAITRSAITSSQSTFNLSAGSSTDVTVELANCESGSDLIVFFNYTAASSTAGDQIDISGLRNSGTVGTSIVGAPVQNFLALPAAHVIKFLAAAGTNTVGVRFSADSGNSSNVIGIVYSLFALEIKK